MSNHLAVVIWRCNEAVFTDKRFSRAHTWQFDGGATVTASASPQLVPPPYSEPAAVDPEEAFVAALSSCHMLTFLYLAAQRGFKVDSYRDKAVGTLTKNEAGRLAITRVRLTPAVSYSENKQPSEAEESALHHRAHEECFLANSVRCEIEICLKSGLSESHASNQKTP